MIYSDMETDVAADMAADLFGWVCYFNTENRRGDWKVPNTIELPDFFILCRALRDFEVHVYREMFTIKNSFHKLKKSNDVFNNVFVARSLNPGNENTKNNLGV